MNKNIVAIVKTMRHRCMMVCENCACNDGEKCTLTALEEILGIRKEEEEKMKAKKYKLFEKPLYSFNYYEAEIKDSDIVVGMFPKFTLVLQKLGKLQEQTTDFHDYKYQVLKKEDTVEWFILFRKKETKEAK